MAESLDPDRRVDARHGRRPRHVDPIEIIAYLLDQASLDVDPDEGDQRGRFRHLQALIETHGRLAGTAAQDPRLGRRFVAATRDRVLAHIEADPSSVRLVGERGQTLLHDAAMAGDADLTAALLAAGADPDAGELEGHPPLYRASSEAVARVLVKAGATVDVVSGPTRGTPLHQAARRGTAGVARALLDGGADMGARDAKGETPLHRAVNCGQVEVARLLLARGADPRARSKRGSTPLGAARSEEMKRLLGGH